MSKSSACGGGRNSLSAQCARRARRLQRHTAVGNQSSRCGVRLGSGLSLSQKYLGGLSRGFGRTHTLPKRSKRGMLRLPLMAVRFFLERLAHHVGLTREPRAGGRKRGSRCVSAEDGTHFGENAQRTQPLLWAYEPLFGFLPI